MAAVETGKRKKFNMARVTSPVGRAGVVVRILPSNLHYRDLSTQHCSADKARQDVL